MQCRCDCDGVGDVCVRRCGDRIARLPSRSRHRVFSLSTFPLSARLGLGRLFSTSSRSSLSFFYSIHFLYFLGTGLPFVLLPHDGSSPFRFCCFVGSDLLHQPPGTLLTQQGVAASLAVAFSTRILYYGASSGSCSCQETGWKNVRQARPPDAAS